MVATTNAECLHEHALRECEYAHAGMSDRQNQVFTQACEGATSEKLDETDLTRISLPEFEVAAIALSFCSSNSPSLICSVQQTGVCARTVELVKQIHRMRVAVSKALQASNSVLAASGI
eukprot:267589-Pelagomonas_calceolata.AAC.1